MVIQNPLYTILDPLVGRKIKVYYITSPEYVSKHKHLFANTHIPIVRVSITDVFTKDIELIRANQDPKNRTNEFIKYWPDIKCHEGIAEICGWSEDHDREMEPPWITFDLVINDIQPAEVSFDLSEPNWNLEIIDEE